MNVLLTLNATPITPFLQELVNSLGSACAQRLVLYFL